MSTKELAIATSTVWVVVAAMLVMFMQAGFAFLEAGLTRMKNVGHIAAKNALILALASIVYYLVGFGLAFGDGGNGLVGGSGFLPSVDELLAVGAEPFSWFAAVPAAAGVPVPGRVRRGLARDRLGRDGRADEALGVLRLRRRLHAHLLASSRTGSGARTAGCSRRECRTSPGSTVVHYQGALAGLAGALLLGPRIGKYVDGKPQPIPGHNMAFITLGVLILWFGWFGFNAGSTLCVDFGGVGFFAYVALNTNLAAAAGILGAVITSWLVIKKPDLSMMLNGAIGGLVAITAACAFVAPWAAILIGLVAGVDRRARRRSSSSGSGSTTRSARSPHTACPASGARSSLGFLTVPELAEKLATGNPAASSTAAGSTSSASQALGLAAVGAFTFTRVVPRPRAAEGHDRDPHRARGRGGRARRVRARHVGLSRVLHPGPGRIRDRAPRPRGRDRCEARDRRPSRPRRLHRGRDLSGAGPVRAQIPGRALTAART